MRSPCFSSPSLSLSAFGVPKPSSPAARTTGRPTTSSSRSWPDSRSSSGLGLLTSLVVVGRQVGYRRRVERAREAEHARLAQAALTDSLTGLGNHRAFHEDLEREFARRARSGSCFSVVMLDLDGLKQINDTLGHQAGDARLRALGECLRATMRATDSAYRIGGDELMVLLPDERAWGAFTFAQRLQREAPESSHRRHVHLRHRRVALASRAPRRSFATSTSPSTRPSVPDAGSSSTPTVSRRSRPRRPRSARTATTSGSSPQRSRARSTPRTRERGTTARPSRSCVC